mmetsp:Transcript_113821/g.361773  ORF Transcript_113821/g.361773 Transcript_113821/m.361773 type:complete len:249 (-) Transcript_113821:1042-1788(-)
MCTRLSWCLLEASPIHPELRRGCQVEGAHRGHHPTLEVFGCVLVYCSGCILRRDLRLGIQRRLSGSLRLGHIVCRMFAQWWLSAEVVSLRRSLASPVSLQHSWGGCIAVLGNILCFYIVERSRFRRHGDRLHGIGLHLRDADQKFGLAAVGHKSDTILAHGIDILWLADDLVVRQAPLGRGRHALRLGARRQDICGIAPLNVHHDQPHDLRADGVRDGLREHPLVLRPPGSAGAGWRLAAVFCRSAAP